MNNKIIYIIALFFSFSSSALAQLNSRNNVILSEPVGGDYLPGGKILQATDIRESFLFSQLLPFLITYAIRIAIALSVIVLMIGGYQYITAFGDDEKYKTAQKTITYALIGLVIAITAFGLVRIITNIKIVN